MIMYVNNIKYFDNVNKKNLILSLYRNMDGQRSIWIDFEEVDTGQKIRTTKI